MNSTNILLGTTGVLLVVALFFSFSKMNEGKSENSGKIEALARELERLEAEKEELEKSRAPGAIIFSSPATSPDPAAVPVKTEGANERLAEIQGQIDALTNENAALRDDLDKVNQPEPALDLTALEEEGEEEPETSVDSSLIERRARLIRNAILQATVTGWDAENWMAAIEPTAKHNFSVGDELALRRNDGILCTFHISRQAGTQFIADLKSKLSQGAPEIVPGDELIIPPAFDGKLD